MTTKDIVEFVELLRKLPEERPREIYFMIKGAALVIESGR